MHSNVLCILVFSPEEMTCKHEKNEPKHTNSAISFNSNQIDASLITVIKLGKAASRMYQWCAIIGPPLTEFFNLACSGSYFRVPISFVRDCTFGFRPVYQTKQV